MRRARKSAASTVVVAVLLGLVASCTSSQGPPPPLRVIEFSATGSGPSAYGRYAIVGELDSTSLETFTSLPFSQSVFASPDAAPKMAVALANAQINSRVSCRIAVGGRVLATATASGPGDEATCTVPPGSLR